MSRMHPQSSHKEFAGGNGSQTPGGPIAQHRNQITKLEYYLDPPLRNVIQLFFFIYSTYSADVHFDDRNERAPR